MHRPPKLRKFKRGEAWECVCQALVYTAVRVDQDPRGIVIAAVVLQPWLQSFRDHNAKPIIIMLVQVDSYLMFTSSQASDWIPKNVIIFRLIFVAYAT